MKMILKFLSKLIAIAFAVFYLSIILMLIIICPIMAISNGVEIINTGYTVTTEYIPLIIVILTFVYASLKFKNLRAIYNVFPFLYEMIKFLVIANLFVDLGVEFLNWSYIILNPTRNRIGILVFIISLIIWRIFISVYYFKNPLINFYKNDKVNYKLK